MKAFVYVLFGAVLAFILIALFMRPQWIGHRTGGYRPDLSPYARHGGGPNRPGILY
jgi:hypothetical protein